MHSRHTQVPMAIRTPLHTVRAGRVGESVCAHQRQSGSLSCAVRAAVPFLISAHATRTNELLEGGEQRGVPPLPLA